MEALIEAGWYRPGWSAAHSVGSWRIVWRRESGSGRGAFDGGGGFEERGLSAFDDQFLEFGGDYPLSLPQHPLRQKRSIHTYPFDRAGQIATTQKVQLRAVRDYPQEHCHISRHQGKQ